MSARKLQIWIQKIKLASGPDRTPPAEEASGEGEGEEEAKEEDEEEKPKKQDNEIDMEAEDTIDPVAAVIRVKIPKVPREPEQDEDGNDIIVEVNESELEDIPFEDKCLQVVTKMEDQ